MTPFQHREVETSKFASVQYIGHANYQLALRLAVDHIESFIIRQRIYRLNSAFIYLPLSFSLANSLQIQRLNLISIYFANGVGIVMQFMLMNQYYNTSSNSGAIVSNLGARRRREPRMRWRIS